MSKLEKAKEVVSEHIKDGTCGIYNTCNIMGDHLVPLYSNDGLVIFICYYFSYFEVFGLSDEEFMELVNFYDNLVEETRKERKGNE